jgi:DNA-binding response OmpR family regulator
MSPGRNARSGSKRRAGQRGDVSNPIVIVEDDRDIQALLIDFLLDHGIEAVSAPAHAEAISRRPSPPSAFLIDLMLPGGNGIDLAAQLRHLFPETPMLAMSASRLLLETAVSSRLFDAHLGKPFDLPLLLESVRSAVELSVVSSH